MTVYKMTNTVSNAFYIGATTTTLQKRLTNHKLSFRAIRKKGGSETKWFKEFEKMGEENWIIEPLEVCKTKQELVAKESYWIKHFDATIKGLNTLKKGGITKTKNSTKAKLSELAIERFESEKGKALKENLSKMQKERIANGTNKVVQGFGAAHRLHKKIVVYDFKEQKVVKVFDGSFEIERELKVNQSDVIKCCKRKKEYIKNYFFFYEEEFDEKHAIKRLAEYNFKKENKIRKGAKTVICRNINTRKEKKFWSLTKCAEFLEVSTAWLSINLINNKRFVCKVYEVIEMPTSEKTE